MPTKKNNGNKEQNYIGSGEHGGEYTYNNHSDSNNSQIKNIKPISINSPPINIINKCNFCNSKLVKKVDTYESCSDIYDIPIKYKSNCVAKKLMGKYLITERYFDENGDVYLDIDYTNHGNPKTHPNVPHIHKWIKIDGKFRRLKGDIFR